MVTSSPATADGIVKPTNDELDYRALTLENGMVCLLVHDAETDKAAAAMDVRVGHFSDPWDIPGLAHFLEHMLFYSSDKYPLEDEYSKFLAENGGNSNAYTDTESTNYHFTVRADTFEPALDRFAQFFICPQISKDGVDREINAVDSENGKNLNTDAWRMRQLLKHLSSPTHTYHKFGTGNLATLQEAPAAKGINTHEALRDFYHTFYSANVMRLVVYGKEDLDTLESLVRSKFSPVANKSLEVPVHPGDPFEPQHVGALIKMVPTKEGQSLKLQWPVPAQQALYRKGVCHYISHLIGHEGGGSIFALLKQLGWASALSAGHGGDSYSSQSFFDVSVDLTEAGHENVVEVVRTVFRYVALLRAQGIQRWIFDEIVAIDETRFNFRDKLSPYSVCSALSSGMQIYEQRDWLLGPYAVPQEYDEAGIREVLECMTPANVRALWSSKKFEGGTDSTEPWYGTAYSTERLPDAWMAAGLDTSADPRLHLPTPNEFVPTDFALLPPEAPPGASVDTPSLVRETEMSRLWYKPETLFKMPKGVVYLDFITPASYDSPEASVLTRLFTKCLVDSLNEVAYYAEIAGLAYVISNTTHGFQLYCSGYSHKLLVLVNTIVARIAAYEVDDERFKIVRERVLQDYSNVKYDQPYQRAMYSTSMLQEAKRWHVEEYVAVTPTITAGDLRAFVKRLTGRIFLECYVHGNVPLRDAEGLAEHVEGVMAGSLGSRPLFPSQHAEARIVQAPRGSSLWREPVPNPKDENSAIDLVFQLGPDEFKKNVLGQLWVQVAQRDAFQQLRTQEQLGYMVFVMSSNDLGVRGLRFILQSTAYSAAYLESRVEAFIVRFGERVAGLGDAEFAEAVNTLVAVREEKLKTVSQEARRYWAEIEDGTNCFQRVKEEVAVLKGLVLPELQAFHVERVSLGGPSRRCLSVCVEAQAGAGAGRAAVEGGPADRVPIEDMYSFKRSLPTYGSNKGVVKHRPPVARAAL